MRKYHDLKIYGRAKIFAKEIYTTTAKFPNHEQFALTSQLRRASVSVFSNIVEGSVRESNKEFYRFLTISIASLCEIEAQLEFALEVNYLNQKDFETRLNSLIELRKMIISFRKTINLK